MFFDFFHKEKSETVLLLHLGSGFVCGAVAVIDEKGLPKILSSARMPISVLEEALAENLLMEIDTFLDKVISRVVVQSFATPEFKSRSKHLSSVLVSLASPWFHSRSKKIHLSQEKPFTVTKQLLDDAIKNETEMFEKELAGENPEVADSFVSIEKSIIHTKLNGYELLDCINKTTKTLDMFLCVSVTEKNIVNKLSEAIWKRLHIAHDKILMHSFPLVSFSVIRNIFHPTTGFMLLDIGGEVSDLSVVSDGVLQQTISFPSGRNFLVRQIAKTLKVSTEIAESTLRMFIDGKADGITEDTMQNVLSDVEKEWAIYFEDAVFTLSKHGLPSKMYMTAEGDTARVYSDFLRMSKTDASANFRKNLDLTLVTHDTLAQYYTANNPNFHDEFLALLSIFYTKVRFGK